MKKIQLFDLPGDAQIYNLCPCPITARTHQGQDTVIPTDAAPFPAAVIEDAHYIADPDRVVVVGLPSPLDGHVYIVERDVFDARPERTDLLTPVGPADAVTEFCMHRGCG